MIGDGTQRRVRKNTSKNCLALKFLENNDEVLIVLKGKTRKIRHNNLIEICSETCTIIIIIRKT